VIVRHAGTDAQRGPEDVCPTEAAAGLEVTSSSEVWICDIANFRFTPIQILVVQRKSGHSNSRTRLKPPLIYRCAITDPMRNDADDVLHARFCLGPYWILRLEVFEVAAASARWHSPTTNHSILARNSRHAPDRPSTPILYVPKGMRLALIVHTIQIRKITARWACRSSHGVQQVWFRPWLYRRSTFLL